MEINYKIISDVSEYTVRNIVMLYTGEVTRREVEKTALYFLNEQEDKDRINLTIIDEESILELLLDIYHTHTIEERRRINEHLLALKFFDDCQILYRPNCI